MIRRKCNHKPARWYLREYSKKTGEQFRSYYAFSIARVVNCHGESFWQLLIGPYAFAWGYKNRRK